MAGKAIKIDHRGKSTDSQKHKKKLKPIAGDTLINKAMGNP